MMPVSARYASAVPVRIPSACGAGNCRGRPPSCPGRCCAGRCEPVQGAWQQTGEAVASDYAWLRVHRLAVAGERSGGTAWLRERQGGRVWTGRG